MECKNCLKVFGKKMVHKDEGCIVAVGIICTVCNLKGHFSADCKEKWRHYTRPPFLEDMIPYHLRKRYGIYTLTPIDYDERKGCSEEINDINTIIVKLDEKSMKKTLKEYGLTVSIDEDENIHTISEYAKSNGYKIKFIH
jgi:hypothetical protein